MTAKLTTIAGKVMFGLVLLATVSALAVIVIIPRAVGGATLTVLTGSMTPAIAVGSVVVVRPVDPSTLQIGDVITYQKAPGKGTYITHRITEVHWDTDPATFTTKGDANPGADPDPVPVTAVRGKVLFSVPHLGTFRNLVSTEATGLILLVLGLAGYALFQVLSLVRDHAGDVSDTPTPMVRAPVSLRLQLLIVTLPIAAFDGLSPATVARLLRMDLVDEGVEAFTLALGREPEQLDELEDLLRPFAPLSTERSTVVSVATCPNLPIAQGHEEARDVAA